MEGKIHINGLRIHGHHGVLAQERRVGNEFVYDIIIETDIAKAAANDDLGATINYAEVIDIVKLINSTPSLLLENVAYRLNKALRERFPSITHMTITVSKPSPPIPSIDLKSVSVTISTID